MKGWPTHPVIFEINTCVWLGELSRRYRRAVTLQQVPKTEWDAIERLHVDAVWFMGVWERSPAGLEIIRSQHSLMAEFARTLPDLTEQDIAGSPYCVRRYVVDDALGGPAGLAEARTQLARRGLRLILDFVPNHVAPDHPWADEHPEYFVRGDHEDLQRDPASFMERHGHVYACGRDPYFPAWPDVLQLNAFDHGLRRAAIETISNIALQCDGIRCDMAMLPINAVFKRTWGERVGLMPQNDYWTDLIPSVRATRQGFLFIAEAYWDMESELQGQGFDHCYDKTLYDRLVQGDAGNVRQHVSAEAEYQRRLVRFLENHDEPRAAATFPPGKHRAAAVAVLSLPGAKLLHEGQFQGREMRVPVFLMRRPKEAPDLDLERFYHDLLRQTAQEPFLTGQWSLCQCSGWPDNTSYRNILASCWKHDGARCVVIVNFSDTPSQARVRVPWLDMAAKLWRLTDPLSGDTYDRQGDELAGPGLYVSLESWRWHFFHVEMLP